MPTFQPLSLVAAADRDRAMRALVAGASRLPTRWVSGPEGVARQDKLPGGRDFTECEFTWRDLESNLVSLQLLTTEGGSGHKGAEMVGGVDHLEVVDGVVHAAGWLFDTEQGRLAADMLLQAGKLAVSVGPSEAVTVEYRCTEEDADGWCISDEVVFVAYEIGSLAIVPTQGMDAATIIPDPATVDTPDSQDGAASSVTAAASVAVASDVFARPEPEVGSPLLVEQYEPRTRVSGWAQPLSIDADGVVTGHLAWWGACHTGMPGCQTAPPSPTGYAEFLLHPLACADGRTVNTGPLVVGCDHADLALFAPEARDHYAHAGLAWADVRIVDGQHGPWISGQVRPGLTDDQLVTLNASSISGDWRDLGRGLDLCAALTVSTPGFVVRPAADGFAMAASAAGRRERGGVVVAAVGSMQVRRECRACAERGDTFAAAARVVARHVAATARR